MHTLVDKQLVIASHNKSKVQEITNLFTPFTVRIVTASDLYLPVPREVGATFSENAVLKASTAAFITGLPAFADDSGLVVKDLNGEPGIRSARWSKCRNDFTIAMARVHAALREKSTYLACFICSLAVAWPDRHIETFEGMIQGTLTWPPRGSNGFGYDSIFQPFGYQVTFAELDSHIKHTINHRTKAFHKMTAVYFSKA